MPDTRLLLVIISEVLSHFVLKMCGLNFGTRPRRYSICLTFIFIPFIQNLFSSQVVPIIRFLCTLTVKKNLLRFICLLTVISKSWFRFTPWLDLHCTMIRGYMREPLNVIATMVALPGHKAKSSHNEQLEEWEMK